MGDALRDEWAAFFRTEPEHLRYELRAMVSNFDELRVRALEVTSGLLDAPDGEVADGCRELIKAVESLDQRVREIHLGFSLAGRR